MVGFFKNRIDVLFIGVFFVMSVSGYDEYPEDQIKPATVKEDDFVLVKNEIVAYEYDDAGNRVCRKVVKRRFKGEISLKGAQVLGASENDLKNKDLDDNDKTIE